MPVEDFGDSSLLLGLAPTVSAFNTALQELRAELDIDATHQLFDRSDPGGPVPDVAWWDNTDAFLESLASRAFASIFSVRPDNQPRPIAGAIARYEPVLRKVPHYYFPAAEPWNKEILRSPRTIEEHMRYLQERVIIKGHFAPLVSPKNPSQDTGLIALLEHMVMYPKQRKKWAKHSMGAIIVRDTLVVEDLQTCLFVSSKGREWYQPDRGCLLTPFVAHDGRLVGHGLVVYDRRLPLKGEGIEKLVKAWELVFFTTFAPLVANLNSAGLSALDGFFLGRLRELRHILLRSGRPRTEEPAVPEYDWFVLNKMSIYELLEARLRNREDRFAMAFFDLDGFKRVNNKIGHQNADVLLYDIAAQLLDWNGGFLSPKNGRWLGRFGGDEFIAVVRSDDDIQSTSEAIASAIGKAQAIYNERADERVKYDYDTETGEKLHLTTSIGWVTSTDVRTYGTAIGLDPGRKVLLDGMQKAHRLVELADSDTQEMVKQLGKCGWLDFAARRKYSADMESMCRELPAWMKRVTWLEPRKQARIPKLKLRFTPDETA